MCSILLAFMIGLRFQTCICSVKNTGVHDAGLPVTMEEFLGEYKQTITELRSDMAHLSSVVKIQQDRIHELENRLEEMTGTKQKKQEHNQADTETSITVNEEAAAEKVTSPSARKKTTELLKTVQPAYVARLRFARSRRQVSIVQEHIAFCAYLDHVVTHMGIGHVVKYNQIITNDGLGYNTHTGVFTAPITGMYLFLFHFVSGHGKTEIRLVVDDVNIVGSVVGHPNNPNDLMGGNSAIVHVTKGQAVWTETYYTGDQEVRSEPDYHKTTFSGVLLYSTY